MKYLSTLKYTLVAIAALSFMACDDEDPSITIDTPSTYTFERSGSSTVSFSGQTERISMGEELIDAMKDDETLELSLLEMYRNADAQGNDADPFSSADLNASTKSIKSKVAAGATLGFSTVSSNAAKNLFETWIQNQVNVVFPSYETLAAAGQAGQIADGSSTRYVNEQGLEYDQLVNKSLIGALMVDQIINNYLTKEVLDEGENITENDNGTLAADKNYTTMEHKWDEAYGYIYGTSFDKADPNKTIGEDDSFLNKYIGRVEGDDDFVGIADDIYNALKTGRAAIVAKNYGVRDAQANIVIKKLAEVIGIRAVYYLQQGKGAIASAEFGTAFHDLSEGYGFIYSLKFVKLSSDGALLFSESEVDGFLTKLLGDGDNGLWDVKEETLDEISDAIAAKFEFTVAQAAD